MERRKTPRTSVRKLGYVNFEPYNTGGVITDVSTAGLRFHTVAPVQQGGLVRLSLTLGAMKQIEAVGELVWTDSTRQIGGVRFVVLPPAAVDQINNWLENSASANAGENDAISETEVTETIAPLSASSSAELEKLQASGPNGVDEKHQAPKPVLPPVVPTVPPQNTPLPAPGVEPNLRSAWVPPSARPYSAASSIGPQSSDAAKDDAPRGSTQPPYGFVLPGQPSTMPWITHFDPDPPERRSAFARGLIAVVIVCLLLAPVVWFGLHRYVWRSGSLSPADSVASNPISAPSDAAATNPVLPAGDLPNTADANSSAGNPVGAKSMTAANPAPSPEQGSSVQATSAVPNPQATPNPSPVNPKPGAATQSAQASPADAKPVTKPEPAAAVPSEPAQSPIARSPIAASGPRDIAPDSLALASQPVAKTPPPAPAPEPENPGEAQLILAWQYLEGQGGKPRDPTAASQLLWSAVEKGNLTAETTLANLYLRGEGVPKNCDQARVLLSAASDKGSAEAKRKLLELNQTGCH